MPHQVVLVEVEVEKVEAIMTVETNNKTISKRINFKVKEKDVEVIIQQNQSQQTSPMLNATDVTGMVITSQNVILI